MTSIQVGAKAIYEGLQRAVETKTGFLVGRFGTVECDVLHWLEHLPSAACPQEQRDVLERNAGVFPSDIESVVSWGSASRGAYQRADILATGWFVPMAEKEKELLGVWLWKGTQVPLRSLEPYYVDAEERWTRLLAGRRVCAVTSFADTAARQVKKGEAVVWGGEMKLLGNQETRWSFVRTGYAPCLALGRAGWELEDGESPVCWEDAVEWTVRQVVGTAAEIVIIGCGGLGMIIGARLKALGKAVIVLGGATQVLFGIKGERWKRHQVIGQMWNSEWVWPSEEETPRGAEDVEGACYWLKPQ